MTSMNKDAIFTDAKGDSWHIAITYGDILRVKRHVKGADGKPLDLCLIAEAGDFRQVTDHIEIVVQCVYWLLVDSIREITGLDGMAAMEEFYSRIDSNTIAEMTKAWYEALLNFTPFPVVKAAMIAAGMMKQQADLIAAIDILAGQLEECTSSQESQDAIQQGFLMVNSQRWLNPI